MKIIYNVVETRSNGDCNLANPASSINEAMHSICFYLKCEKAECEGSSIHIDGNDFYVLDKEGNRVTTYKIIETFCSNNSPLGTKIPFYNIPDNWHL